MSTEMMPNPALRYKVRTNLSNKARTEPIPVKSDQLNIQLKVSSRSWTFSDQAKEILLHAKKVWKHLRSVT